MFRVGCIYLLTNLLSGKKYVGQTIGKAERRWAAHIRAAHNLNQQEPLYRAIRKYGVNSFSAEIICVCTEPLLDAAEQHFICKYSSFIDNGGYNLQHGGQGECRVAGKKTRSKISAAVKLRWQDPVYRDKMCILRKETLRNPDIKAAYVARLHTPEASAKSAAARLGKKQTEAHRAAILSGNTIRWSKSEEYVKASKAAKKRHLVNPLSEDAKRRIGAAAKLRAIYAQRTVTGEFTCAQ